MADELALQVLEIDAPVGVFVDDDDGGRRLTPRQLVGVVLVGADEDDGTLALGDEAREAVAGVELGRDAQVHALDEHVDGAGGAGAG